MIYKIAHDIEFNGKTMTVDTLIKEDEIDWIQTSLRDTEYPYTIILKRDLTVYPDYYLKNSIHGRKARKTEKLIKLKSLSDMQVFPS